MKQWNLSHQLTLCGRLPFQAILQKTYVKVSTTYSDIVLDVTSHVGSNSTTITVAIIAVVLFASFMLIVLIGLLLCGKKSIKMSPRLQNLGNTFHVDAEKIDPYYVPIEVEPYIHKCESVGSILEHLSSPQKDDKPAFVSPPANSSSSLKQAIVEDNSVAQGYKFYILQPPPFKNEFSIDSSNYQSSSTTTIASSHLEETGDLSSPTGYYHGIGPSSISSSDSNCKDEKGYSTQKDKWKADESCGTENFACNVDEMCACIFHEDEGEDEGGHVPSSFQDDHIVLTFSPSPKCDKIDLITYPEEDETLNLSINPHHFDPL